MVTILVGPEKTPFHVHRTVLVEKIPYFRALLGTDWDNGQKDNIELDDVPVADFEVVMHWGYTERLPKSMMIKSRVDYRLPIDADPYKAADRLMVARLQNAICNHIIDTLSKYSLYFDWEALKVMYDMELSHSLLYRLMVKSAVETFMQRGDTDDKVWISGLDQLLDCPAIMKDVLLSIDSYNSRHGEKYGSLIASSFTLTK